ncbi:hypothetical protein HMPREF9431_01636 [Segatella oulorum F0390]|uniref:Uncharacterized protein n=1 Tax=Segatella oulorum F0390 TaxID=702438 RepID=G1WCT5_9BACT|nr:hypothetical protein HMPREF9431_01636 [Segatella oulorum F0390]
MRVFLVWKRRYADVRAGTQVPPLRILLERIARGCSPLRIWYCPKKCVTIISHIFHFVQNYSLFFQHLH